MPYIVAERREELLHKEGEYPTTAGELNFLITKIILEFLEATPTYASYNEVIGVLECCKLEMYRRAVGPYEDTAIEKNGDVYE